jgi:competence protein ComEA
MKTRLKALAAVVAGSRWGTLAGRIAGYLAAFALLALVGSGRLSGWTAPPARLAVGVAEAATAAPAASAEPQASAAPSAVASAEASAEPDAGTAPAEEGDAGAQGAVAADGKVILNLAAEEDLRRLPGVGPTRAQAILALRTRMKRFTRVEDLLRVKGLGRRALAKIRPHVRID